MSEKKHSFSKPFGGFVNAMPAREHGKIFGHFVAASGEFVGTFMFLLCAFLGHEMAVRTQDGHPPGISKSNSTVIYIGLGYGMSLLVNAFIFFRISGGLFNPAVAVGMVLTGHLPAIRGAVLLIPQILGAIAAAGVVEGIIPGTIATVDTTLAPGVGVAQGLFLEMFLTAQLVITVIMLAGEKHKGTFIAPIGIGLALFVAQIAGVYWTGASVNPARSFGPCVVSAHFQGYHWIYWLGPVLGAVISAGFFHFLKFLEYENANPDQDSAGGHFDESPAAVEARRSRGSSDMDNLAKAINRANSMSTSDDSKEPGEMV